MSYCSHRSYASYRILHFLHPQSIIRNADNLRSDLDIFLLSNARNFDNCKYFVFMEISEKFAVQISNTLFENSLQNFDLVHIHNLHFGSKARPWNRHHHFLQSRSGIHDHMDVNDGVTG
jgi:hypothetical protein